MSQNIETEESNKTRTAVNQQRWFKSETQNPKCQTNTKCKLKGLLASSFVPQLLSWDQTQDKIKKHAFQFWVLLYIYLVILKKDYTNNKTET